MGRGRRGQVVLEAAWVLPVVLALGVGALEWARLAQAQLLVQEAARRAARAGALHGGRRAAMEAAARTALLPVLGRGGDVHDAGRLLARWARPDAVRFDVAVCGAPRAAEGDFDAPALARGEAGRLAVEVTLHLPPLLAPARVLPVRARASRRLQSNLVREAPAPARCVLTP